MTAVPDGEWFCPECEADSGAPVGASASKKGKKKAKAQATKEEAEEDGPEHKAAGKRKAPTKSKAGGGPAVSLPDVTILTDPCCSVKAQEIITR